MMSLSAGGEYIIDASYIKTVAFSIEWGGDGVQDGDVFGASIVMFDRQGRFVDGVDARRVRSRRGPRVAFGPSSGRREQFAVDLRDPLQEGVFAYFLVLNGRTDSSDLRKLGNIRVRLINGDTNIVENCRYEVSVGAATTSLLLARAWKDPKNNKVSSSY